MSLSAKRLGKQYGLSSQEMNVLLKEQGFLSGIPGNYALTEKGKYFAVEKNGENGYGGFAARSWEWREWNESIINELDLSPEYIEYIRSKTKDERRMKNREEKANKTRADYSNTQSYTQSHTTSSRAGCLGLLLMSILFTASLFISIFFA